MPGFLFSLQLLFAVMVVRGQPSPKAQLNDLISVNNIVFGIRLFNNISKEDKNVVFSPLSVSTIMSEIYLGAEENTRIEVGLLGYIFMEGLFAYNISKTYQNLFNQLRNTSEEKLEIANVLITRTDFKVLNEYKTILEHFYDALIINVDFRKDNDLVVGKINDWVSQKTHRKIPEFLGNRSLDKDTRLLFFNAIYFNGNWKTQFDPKMTRNQSFYNNGRNNSVSVPMMNLNATLPYFNDIDRRLKMVQLPYKGNDMSMIIVLPYERNGLARIKKEIDNYESLKKFFDNLRDRKVTLSFPKFKLEYSRNLKKDFKIFGIHDLFESDANLSRISTKKDFYVSDIIHRVTIEVNEKGSEAVAVTGSFASEDTSSLPIISNELKVDHPFLFYIIHNESKTILFVGCVDKL